MKVIAYSLIVAIVVGAVASGCRAAPASGQSEGSAKPEVRVSILAKNNVLVGDTKASPREAGKTLETLGVAKDTLITFTVNGELPYKFVQSVISSVNHAGYTRISVTKVK